MTKPDERAVPEREDSFAAARRAMVKNQLIGKGIHDSRVLMAMSQVPREEFVPIEYQEAAYRNAPLPIGFGQTISQPYTVAYLAQALQLNGDEKVLEIGAGSGYQAAVLARLAERVHTVERLPELHEQAAERLLRMGYDNVVVHLANGTLGLLQDQPFDAIVATASSADLPGPLAEQLAEGGRMVIPLGSHRQAQRLFRFTLENGNLRREDLGGFVFVPLIGEHGWQEDANDW